MKALVAALAVAGSLVAAQAHAANFNFTFAGTTPFFGTVTGEVFGLTDGTSTPTEVKVFSSTNPSEPYPLDFTSVNSTFTGTLSVTNGVVTADSFSLLQSSTGLGLGLNSGGTNYFGTVGGSSSTDGVQNQAGFAGATFTSAAVSAAPEPGAWALMLGGVGAMGLMLRRRRRAGATFAA